MAADWANYSIYNFLLFLMFLNLLGITRNNDGQVLGATDFKVVKPWGDTLTDDLLQDIAQYSSFDSVKNEYLSGPTDGISWQDVDGAKLRDTMSKDLELLLTGKIEALKKAVEKAKELELEFDYDEVELHPEEYDRVDYLSAKPEMDDDDDEEEEENPFANATLDPAVGRPVLLDQSSVHIPVEVYDKDERVLEAINWTATLDEVWKENRETDPDLAWQYFGSSTGFMRTYPASAWTFPAGKVDLYDCRRRPWYTQGSSSPKDMLILVDTSGSSHGQALELMRIATKTLIDTLGENDFVFLAHFPVRVDEDNTTDEEAPSQSTCKKPEDYKKYQGHSSGNSSDTHEVSCFNTFVQANNRNKKILFDAVDELEAFGMADFNEAFCWAFDQFKTFRTIKNVGSNCTEMIMVLTDGSTQYPAEVFKTRNPNQEVRVFTYAVGIAATAVSTVKRMACANRGYFSPIPAMGAINSKVQEYEPVISRPFALTQQEQLHWSSSYVDAPQVDSGMVITATIPVFKQPRKIVDEDGIETYEENSHKILGVMGLDVRTAELEERAPVAQLGPSGYTFAINNNGLVIFHPRLRSEMGYLKDPPNVDLLDIEYKAEGMEEIRNNMVDGKKGSKTITTCSKAQDNKHIECGKRTYYYAPIKGTPLSLGISIPQQSKKVLKVSGRDPIAALEKLKDDKTHSGESRLMIAPWKFCQPIENATDDDLVGNLIEAIAGGCNSERVQHLLYDADKTRHVSKDNVQLKEGVINSFVSTHGGVTRIFPAEDDMMNNLTDTWNMVFFRRAIDTPTSWIFIPEVNGTDNIMAVKAVVLDNEYRPAVAGVHVTSAYLHDLMITHTSNIELSCGDSDNTICYLLDEGAFIVNSNQENQNGLFVGDVDPYIMNEMIELDVYKQFVEFDFQGTCVVYRKYNSAGHRDFRIPSLIPLDALSLSWWTTKLAAAWGQASLYSWAQSMYASYGAASDVDSDDDVSYRACILKQAQYDYGKTIEKESLVQSEVTACNCTRSFGLSRLAGTNLLLVVAESDALCEEPSCEMDPSLLPVQEPKEDKGPDMCLQQTQPRHRNVLGEQCIKNHPREKQLDLPCGKGNGLVPSTFFMVLTLFGAFLQILYH